MPSERAADVVRYLKHLEDGPVYRTHWFSPDGMPPYGCWATPDGDTALAQTLDFKLTLEDQMVAAVNYLRDRYGPPSIDIGGSTTRST